MRAISSIIIAYPFAALWCTTVRCERWCENICSENSCCASNSCMAIYTRMQRGRCTEVSGPVLFRKAIPRKEQTNHICALSSPIFDFFDCCLRALITWSWDVRWICCMARYRNVTHRAQPFECFRWRCTLRTVVACIGDIRCGGGRLQIRCRPMLWRWSR